MKSTLNARQVLPERHLCHYLSTMLQRLSVAYSHHLHTAQPVSWCAAWHNRRSLLPLTWSTRLLQQRRREARLTFSCDAADFHCGSKGLSAPTDYWQEGSKSFPSWFEHRENSSDILAPQARPTNMTCVCHPLVAGCHLLQKGLAKAEETHQHLALSLGDSNQATFRGFLCMWGVYLRDKPLLG